MKAVFARLGLMSAKSGIALARLNVAFARLRLALVLPVLALAIDVAVAPRLLHSYADAFQAGSLDPRDSRAVEVGRLRSVGIDFTVADLDDKADVAALLASTAAPNEILASVIAASTIGSRPGSIAMAIANSYATVSAAEESGFREFLKTMPRVEVGGTRFYAAAAGDGAGHFNHVATVLLPQAFDGTDYRKLLAGALREALAYAERHDVCTLFVGALGVGPSVDVATPRAFVDTVLAALPDSRFDGAVVFLLYEKWPTDYLRAFRAAVSDGLLARLPVALVERVQNRDTRTGVCLLFICLLVTAFRLRLTAVNSLVVAAAYLAGYGVLGQICAFALGGYGVTTAYVAKVVAALVYAGFFPFFASLDRKAILQKLGRKGDS